MKIFEWTEQTPVTANNLNEMQNILNDNAVNELVDKVNYKISTSGNWTIKKYDNGYVEMWLNEEANRSTSIYGNTPIYFGSYNFTFPITLVDIPLGINAISRATSTLTGMCIDNITATYVSIFLESFGGAINNKPVRTYIYVLGKWK